MTLIFEKERDTKNTVRFQEKPPEDEPTAVGVLYVQKWVVKGATKIKVTIEVVE